MWAKTRGNLSSRACSKLFYLSYTGFSLILVELFKVRFFLGEAAETPVLDTLVNVGQGVGKPVVAGLQITLGRAACSSVQSDQQHCLTLIAKYRI